MSQHYSLLPPPEWEGDGLPVDQDGDSWLIVYMDVFTLMLSLFVMMLAYATYAPEDFDQLTRAMVQPVPLQGELPEPVESQPSQAENSRPIEPQTEQQSQLQVETEVEPLPERQAEPPVVETPGPQQASPPDIPVEQQTETVVEQPVEQTTEQQAEQQARQLQQAYQRVLQAQQLQNDVEVTIERNRINLRISDEILFGLGDAELTATGQRLLTRLQPVLIEGERPLSVAGHTDTVPIRNGRFASNWELSTQRATTVVRYLIGLGVPADRLRAIGYADTRPIASNSTAEGRSRNRRVSLVIHTQEQ